MKSIDTTKENREVREYRQKYLAAGKEYSHLLLSASKLSPHILSITKELQNIGNNIAVLDSKTITDFYNSFLSNSKIDPAYHKLAHEVTKAKHTLDHARYALFQKELALAIKKAEIPVKKHTLTLGELVEIINDRKEKLLTKIAYATPYIKEELIELSQLVESGDVLLSPGEITGASRKGKSFLRDLGQILAQRVNDQYFGKKEFDIKKVYVSTKVDNTNLLGLISHLGDNEHLRELERRINAGDIRLEENQLFSCTDKGSRYLLLLAEELEAILEKNMDEELLLKNSKALEDDSLFTNISQIINDYENRLAKHQNITSRYDGEAIYHGLVSSYSGNILELSKSKDEILSDIERISNAALAVRKKLYILGSLGEVKVGETIPLVSAYRLLANYEKQLDEKIASLSTKLNIDNQVKERFIPSITDIREKVLERESFYEIADRDVDVILPSRIKQREDLDNIIIGFTKNLPEYTEYREVVADINSLKNYLLDYLENENRLYRGNEAIGAIISQLVELEVQREELLAKITHEVQLAHKQVWLSSIRKENDNYFASNIGGNKKLEERAVQLNAKIISQIENDIRNLIGTLKDKHDIHTAEFLRSLQGLAGRVENGEDVSLVSADLREKYMSMDSSHRELITRLNKEMTKLDRQFSDLPIKSRKAIEKNLIIDIKNQVEK